MAETDDLTPRQRRILEFIADTVLDRGYPPTVREIGEAVGLTSSSSVHSQLANLERKGLLHKDPTKPRAIGLADESTRPEGVVIPVLGRIAAHENVWCKLSGLLTEADPDHSREQDLAPYATTVLERFGADRVLYASDWPVLTLAGRYAEWHAFTEHVVASLSDAERQRVYRDNAAQVYEL